MQQQLNNKKEVAAFLQKRMLEKISQLVSYYTVHQSSDEKAKKDLETMEFMNALFTGKNWPKKDMDFKDKHKDLFAEIYSYSDDIKALQD